MRGALLTHIQESMRVMITSHKFREQDLLEEYRSFPCGFISLNRLPHELLFPVFCVNVQPVKQTLLNMCSRRIQTELAVVRRAAGEMATGIIQEFEVHLESRFGTDLLCSLSSDSSSTNLRHLKNGHRRLILLTQQTVS